MSDVQCFWLEPTDRVALKLRRYSRSADKTCPKTGHYCNGERSFGEHPVRLSPKGYLQPYDDMAPPHDDARWPLACDACGQAFAESDEWQVFQEQVYRRADTGADTTLRSAPPGAMFDATWYPKKGPDGRCLSVCLPPGGGLDIWNVDGPANNGPGWTRTGSVPNVTASPSIQTPRYHGWLRDGRLVSC